MQTTRRSFIQTVVSVGAFLAAGGGAITVLGQKRATDLFEIPPEVYSEPLFSLTARHFEQLIGQTFTATAEGGQTVELILTEVKVLERMENTIGGYYGDVFSLLFEGPRRVTLAQDRYEIHADGLPDFPALIVPVSREGREYEIIINRLGR